MFKELEQDVSLLPGQFVLGTSVIAPWSQEISNQEVGPWAPEGQAFLLLPSACSRVGLCWCQGERECVSLGIQVWRRAGGLARVRGIPGHSPGPAQFGPSSSPTVSRNSSAPVQGRRPSQVKRCRPWTWAPTRGVSRPAWLPGRGLLSPATPFLLNN